MQNQQLSFDFESENPATRSVKIKPEFQTILDKDKEREEREINECVNGIMDILYNTEKYEQRYQNNLSMKKDFEEGMLSEIQADVIDFDAMGIDTELAEITSDNFLDNFGDIDLS